MMSVYECRFRVATEAEVTYYLRDQFFVHSCIHVNMSNSRAYS